MSETPGTYKISRNVTACPFCTVEDSRILWSSPDALAISDAFPVSQGHTLIIPRRHAGGWADLTPNEQTHLLAAIDPVRALIAERYAPAAFNVGFNDGAAAGQTVMHFHIHIIPRYTGDVPDPRGGVRWVLRDKAAYWTGRPGD